jgi:hypothetical protein
MQNNQKKFTIRKHLTKGEYFGFWQIRGYITDSKQGEIVQYVNPNTHTLILENCLLHNKVNAAIKIFEGGEKNPCAYIIFEAYQVIPLQEPISEKLVSYNPRNCPHWIVDGQQADFVCLPKIVSNLSKLYI